MASKQVVDRQKSAKQVVASIHTNAAAIAQSRAAFLAPFLQPGEALPDFQLALLLEGRSLEAAIEALVRADVAHQAELSDDEPPRLARDAAGGRVYTTVVDVREAVAGLYSPAAVREAGFVGNTPREDNPEMLARFAEEVIAGIPKLAGHKPRIQGAVLDLQGTLAKLQADVTELNTQLKHVAREAREAQATKLARDRALDAYDARFTQVATLLATELRAAGMPELAERVRPSVRRPGEIADDDETTGGDTGKPAGATGG